MTRRFLAAAVLGAAAWLGLAPSTASAFGGGLFAKKSQGACCAPAHYDHGCGTVAPVTWIDQEVTVKEAKWVTVKEKAWVPTKVEVEKEYTCKVLTHVPVKKEVTVNECSWVKQPYEWMACETVVTKEERTVMKMTYVPEKVMVPVCNWVCTPRTVTTMKTVSHKVPVCDPCNPCATRWTCVTECVPVTCTVIDRQMVTTQVEKIVNKCVPVPEKVMVDVCKVVHVKKVGERMCQVWTPVKKTIDCVECVWVDKKEKCKVWECKLVETMVDVQKCEWIYVKKTVKVAQYAPAPVVGCGTPCGYTPVSYGCDTCSTAKKTGLGLCKKMKSVGSSSCGGCW